MADLRRTPAIPAAGNPAESKFSGKGIRTDDACRRI